ncbi:MAG: hypothetical protein ACYC2G_01015 [Gemmatimonadaceae bacterium]
MSPRVALTSFPDDPMVRGSLMAVLAASLVLAGCGGDADDADLETAAAVRDSAGVRIVESARPRWTERTALAVAAEPLVSIGEMDGPPEYQLYRVRGATRLGDGSLAVFDGGSQELRFYDPAGEFVRRVGGKGGGPGEYQQVAWMRRLPGDSLMLYDVQAQRITVLAPDGALARSVNLAAAAPPPPAPTPAGANERRVQIGGMGRYQVIGPMPDGSLLARAGGQPRISDPGSAVTRDSIALVRLTADGALRDSLGIFAGDERQLSTAGNSGRRMVVVASPPFGRSSRVAMDDDGFWFGSSDRYELTHHSADGRTERIIRRPVEPLAVTPAVTAAAREVELNRVTDAPAEARDMLRQMTTEKWDRATIPATMPAHGELLTDDAGRLWVAETTVPDDTIPRWTAFDADGRMLGTITMPARFRALEFGPDYVLGVATDENEVERVTLHPLRSPTP